MWEAQGHVGQQVARRGHGRTRAALPSPGGGQRELNGFHVSSKQQPRFTQYARSIIRLAASRQPANSAQPSFLLP